VLTLPLRSLRSCCARLLARRYDREAVTFAISVSRHWVSTNQHYNPFFQLLRESIVDHGGELLSCSPLSTPLDDVPEGGRGSLIITGVFLTGELPLRQSGGTKNHVDLFDAVSHFSAFMFYLLHDESFADATDIDIDATRIKSVNAIAASYGVMSFSISSSMPGSSCLFTSPALDATTDLLAKTLAAHSVSSHPSSPRLFCTPKFADVLQQNPAFSSSPPPTFISNDLHEMTSLFSDSSSTLFENPGLGMPLSFVRRFHNVRTTL
jgi:hypothetical protein